MSVNTNNIGFEELSEKWNPILEADSEAPIKDDWKKKVTLRMLENQEKSMITEAPINVTGGVDKWDPVLISMIRRNAPKMIAFDIFGVQPMSGPTGLIFAIRSRYVDGDKDQAGPEAFFDEANSGHCHRRYLFMRKRKFSVFLAKVKNNRTKALEFILDCTEACLFFCVNSGFFFHDEEGLQRR